MDINQYVGENIRWMRTRCGRTIEELAGESHVTFSHLSAVERGKKNISLETLDKIARALGVEASVLLIDRARAADESVSGIHLNRRQSDFSRLTVKQKLQIMRRLEEDIDAQLALWEAGLVQEKS